MARASKAGRVQRSAPRELGFRGTQVLSFVRDMIDSEGMAPSYSMIRDALGFTQTCDVRAVVVRLESRGLLRRVGSGRVRRIRLNAH